MPATLRYGITYPAGSVAPNVPVVSQAQAQSVEAALGLVDDRLTKSALGLVYQAKKTTSSPGTANAVIHHVPSFTFKAGRKYRIVWDQSWLTGGTASLFFCSIGTASLAATPADTNGIATINGRTVQCPIPNSTTYSGAITAEYNPTADTTVMLKFWALRVAGGDLITAVGNANEYGIFSIFDDGAQL